MPDFFSGEKALISEIFSSLQGEGARMGERHLFVRFTGCGVGCVYCDENKKSGREMPLADVLEKIDRTEKCEGPHSCVSLTGGEPLRQVLFLKKLNPAVRSRGLKVLLETNGVLWKEFREIAGSCDVVSMDVKLPSVGHHQDFFEEHRKFLEAARGNELYVKVVVSKGADLAEFDRAVEMIAQTAPDAPVFIQPVWAERTEFQDALAEMLRKARQKLRDVRLGIQVHKMLNLI